MTVVVPAGTKLYPAFATKDKAMKAAKRWKTFGMISNFRRLLLAFASM